jgi:hypothetical protein
MPLANSNLLYQILIPSIVLFFLVWSVVGVGVGLGLIVSPMKMLRLFGSVNHYVSTRHGLKPLSEGHDVEPQVRKNRRWIGTFFILGAVYSIFGLVRWFDNGPIISALSLDLPRPFLAWIVESVRWILIVCSVFAFVIGTLLCFYPNVVYRLEQRTDHWYSFRQLFLGVDTLHLGLDRWVAAFPRAAGLMIVIAALVAVANSAVLWQQLR